MVPAATLLSSVILIIPVTSVKRSAIATVASVVMLGGSSGLCVGVTLWFIGSWLVGDWWTVGGSWLRRLTGLGELELMLGNLLALLYNYPG